MINYFKCLIILLITNMCIGNNFVIVADGNSFFQPCLSSDNGGKVNMADLVELNLKNEYADDIETVITNGNLTVKVDVPENILIMLDVEIFEWKRGKWEKTVYSIRRDDFCRAAFDPMELWYSHSKQIPQEDRVCPPKKGTVYHMNNVVNRLELNNIFGINLEGKYKIVIHFVAEEFSTCITAVLRVWKN